MKTKPAHADADIPANVSFAPKLDWFAFSTQTGRTIGTGFKSKAAAVCWLHAKEGRRAAFRT